MPDEDQAYRRDWTRASEWLDGHAVTQAFNRIADDVLRDKGDGALILRRRLDERSKTALSANYELLLAQTSKADLKIRIKNIVDAMASIDAPNDDLLVDWRACARLIGYDPGTFDANEAIQEGRGLIIGQILSVSPYLLDNPVHATVYSIVQYGIHRALASNATKTEPQVTEAIVSGLRLALGERIIPAVDNEGAALPKGMFLDLASASLQGHHDPFGADFALAVGCWVDGKPVYRVALFQVKIASVTGRVDVGHGDGEQLRTLAATGMGHYLFYPQTDRRCEYLATVRSAAEILGEVSQRRRRPFFSGIGARYGAHAGTEAPDFASFVAFLMTSPDGRKGERLFSSPEDVAAALSEPGARPLAKRLVVMDTTLTLRSTDLVPLGFGPDRPLSLSAAGRSGVPRRTRPDDGGTRRSRP